MLPGDFTSAHFHSGVSFSVRLAPRGRLHLGQFVFLDDRPARAEFALGRFLDHLGVLLELLFDIPSAAFRRCSRRPAAYRSFRATFGQFRIAAHLAVLHDAVGADDERGGNAVELEGRGRLSVSRRIGMRDLQVLECLDEVLVLHLRLVDAHGIERHLGVVLVLLVDLLQIRQALPARPAPGGPKIEHGHLAGQRFGRDRFAVEIEELEVGHSSCPTTGRCAAE